MFQASSCPSSGATTTAVAASGLPIVIRDTAVVVAPDVEHEDARNMLSSI
jgi:phenylalanyl-tRNA synthetase beta subunit